MGALCLVLIVALLALPFLTAHSDDAMSVDSPEPDGAMALAELLRDQGVRVTERDQEREAIDEAVAGTTLVVADSTYLTAKAARAIARSEADVVLIEPNPVRLADIASDVSEAGVDQATTVAPGCPLRAAKRAGQVQLGRSTEYGVTDDVEATTCYHGKDGAHLVQLPAGGRTVTVVSSAYPFQNGALTAAGNAALGMNLLGAHTELTWLLPDPAAVDYAEAGSLPGLISEPVRAALFGLVLAAVAFAVARARRLGPVVAERLPIFVRAAETTQGRARLYRSLRARERAADALRRGTIAKLRAPLQLPRDASASAVVAAVTGRTRRDSGDVGELLYGAPPADDATLVRLADALDTLESEVRRA